MTTRRALWVVIGVLSIMVVVGSTTVGWLLLRPRAAAIRLVVTSDDNDQMRIIAADGSERALDSKVDAQQFRFPAASADGRKLAYVVTDGDTMRIVRLNLATGERNELYSSASRQPFDLAWSPDGQYLIFLAASPNGLSTYVVPDDSSPQVQVVANGSQTYFAWRPDSSALLLHVGGHAMAGGSVSMYQANQKSATPLLRDPGFFDTPAWSLDGSHVFYVAQPPITAAQPTFDDVQGDIVRVTADGKQPQVLVSIPKAMVRMVRSPSSDQIAYTSIAFDAQGGLAEWNALELVDGTTGARRTLSSPDAQVAAFFWSPDGKRIAYLTYTGTLALDSARAWHVVDVASGSVRDLATFTPSKSFNELEQFFDAYLHSLSPWSPDGTRLAYGTDDGVYVLDVASAKATRAAAGTMGVWVGGR